MDTFINRPTKKQKKEKKKKNLVPESTIWRPSIKVYHNSNEKVGYFVLLIFYQTISKKARISKKI